MNRLSGTRTGGDQSRYADAHMYCWVLIGWRGGTRLKNKVRVFGYSGGTEQRSMERRVESFINIAHVNYN